jgi:hypothetical protein
MRLLSLVRVASASTGAPRLDDGAVVSTRDASLSLQPKRAAHGPHAASLLRSRSGRDLRAGSGAARDSFRTNAGARERRR